MIEGVRLRAASWVAIVAANLMPWIAVVTGHMALDEAVVVFFLEVCVTGLITLVKLCTSENARDDAMSLGVYLVLFVVVYVVLAGGAALTMVLSLGLSPLVWGLTGGMAASAVLNLTWFWFARGERHEVARGEVFWLPLLRIFGVFVLMGWVAEAGVSNEVALLLVLLLAKAAFDVALDFREMCLADTSRPVGTRRRKVPLP